MAKYIDAEALVAKFGEEADRLEVGAGDTLAGLYLADTIAYEMPAADVEPVVHAHWIRKTDGWGRRQLACSHCKKHSGLCAAKPRCPHCGARMDRE